MTTKFSIFNFQFSILTVIILLASFLRLYQLLNVPPSPSLDEVSIGYNAYSILQTGADEYGTKFPILLRSYDDWRPALYVYLVIPFIKLFGLTVLAVRLPSIILSVLTVLATYFLTKKLFPNIQKFSIGQVAALFLTISPWHIYISRLGHEANAGFAFFIFSIFFFFRNSIYLFFLFFALSFVSYQSEKIFLPLFFLVLFFLFKERLLQRKRQVLIGVCMAGAILFPFANASLAPNALIRFRATNIFEVNKDRFDKEALILADAVKNNNVFSQILHNRRVVATKIISEAYLSHFNPKWLFTNFSDDKHKVPNLGLFYLWEAPLIILGVFFLIKEKINKKIKLLILSWILIAPLPGAITSDAPHAMRAYTMLPVPQILAAMGTIQIILILRKYHIFKFLIYIFSTIMVVSSIFYFFYNYFVVFPKTQSSSFQYALSQAIPFVLKQQKSYNKIVFSNKDSLYQSYMFFLFYSRYNPTLYQKQGGTISGGFAEKHMFGKYEFRPFHFEQESEKNVLYVGNSSDFTTSSMPIKIFYDLSGKESVYLVEK